MLLLFVGSIAQTNGEPLNGHQQREDKIKMKSDMCEVYGYYNLYLDKYRCEHGGYVNTFKPND